MNFKVITLFPEFIDSLKSYSIIGRSVKDNKISINSIDLRSFGQGPHKKVDDRPYGGGIGMLLKVDVVHDAIKSATKTKSANRKIILLSPQGKQFDQDTAERFSKLDEIVLVCGHYEGFDHRIRDLIDEEISVGPYVLTGGEIPAMIMIDAISRFQEGVLGKIESKSIETFSMVDGKKIIEYPQYTRPNEYIGKCVPEVLTSGDHKEVDSWNKKNTKNIP